MDGIVQQIQRCEKPTASQCRIASKLLLVSSKAEQLTDDTRDDPAYNRKRVPLSSGCDSAMDDFDADQEMTREVIFEIVENQMREGAPPETRQTYDRLMADGHSREQSMKLIGCALTSEIFSVLKENKPFDEERYVAALKALPKLPWDDD